MTEERRQYYDKQFKSIHEQDEKIVAEWKRTHKTPSRGVIVTPERKALQEKDKQLYFAYLRECSASER